MLLRVFGLLCVLVVLVGVSVARAEAPDHALAHPELSHRLWIRGIGTFGELEHQTALMVAPRFGGAFLLGDSVDLDIEVPMVIANVDVPKSDKVETRTLPGNPFVGASYVADERGYRLSAGVGMAAPLAHDDRGDAYDDVAFRFARAARAGREAWLYTPDRLPVVVSASFETKLPHGPVVLTDVAFALMPRVRGKRGEAFEGTSQLGLGLAGQLGESVRLGGRFDVVALPADAGLNRTQLALVPFMQVSTRDGVLFATELTVNVDRPYGPSFTQGGLWGLSVLAGSRF